MYADIQNMCGTSLSLSTKNYSNNTYIKQLHVFSDSIAKMPSLCDFYIYV